MYRIIVPILTLGCVLILGACTSSDSKPANNTATAVVNTQNLPKPSNKFTPADIAKLKWIEGTWRGMDGDKPFYERYKLDGTTLIVEGLKEDGSPDGEPGRFELTNGEFGQGEGEKRSAASEITATYVQFVPAVPGGRRNSFRFERQPGGTWNALLEWPATEDKPAMRKVYRMERWEPKK